MLKLLFRNQAREYLLERHGIELSSEHLARLARDGTGPRFHLLGGRCERAAYAPTDLDVWAAAYVGPAVMSVAEHPAHAHKGRAA
jgi:hypothetical protein